MSDTPAPAPPDAKLDALLALGDGSLKRRWERAKDDPREVGNLVALRVELVRRWAKRPDAAKQDAGYLTEDTLASLGPTLVGPALALAGLAQEFADSTEKTVDELRSPLYSGVGMIRNLCQVIDLLVEEREFPFPHPDEEPGGGTA